MKRAVSILSPAVILLAAFTLIILPDAARAAAADGLTMCYKVIIPSLFPFMVLASMTVTLGYAAYLGRLLEAPMGRFLHLPGACGAALAVGLISGFPVGAKVAAELYADGECSRDDAERMLGFCSNCGPAFIFGFAGAAVLGSAGAGLILFIAQTAAALAVAVITRPKAPPVRSGRENTAAAKVPSFGSAFSGAVRGSFGAVLDICAFVILFSVLGGLMDSAGITDLICGLLSRLGVNTAVSSALIHGLMEISAGVRLAGAKGIPAALRLPLTAAVIGWSGVSVHFQVLSVTESCGLRLGHYLRGKLMTSLLSAFFASLLGRLFTPPAVNAASGFGVTAVSAECALLLPAVLIMIGIKSQKGTGKSAQKEV